MNRECAQLNTSISKSGLVFIRSYHYNVHLAIGEAQFDSGHGTGT